MGGVMREKGFDPEIILVSTAERARHTAELLIEAGKLTGELRPEPQIYEASPQTLRQIVAGIDNRYASAMLVGHNPGVEGLIHFLTGQLEPMSTAALAVVRLAIDGWDEANEGSGQLVALYRPKEMMAN